jgi:hypothetical protein
MIRLKDLLKKAAQGTKETLRVHHLRSQKAQIVAILNDITSVHLPDHAWVALPIGGGRGDYSMKHTRFSLVGAAEARRNLFGISPQSELPRPVYQPLLEAFVGTGVRYHFVLPVKETEMTISTRAGHRYDHSCVHIEYADLKFLRENRERIAAAFGKSGMTYRHGAASMGTKLRY